MNEKQIKIAVREYFANALFRDFSVRVDDDHPNLCAIYFAQNRNGIADIVLCEKKESFTAIADRTFGV